jgi:hypothetical protein
MTVLDEATAVFDRVVCWVQEDAQLNHWTRARLPSQPGPPNYRTAYDLRCDLLFDEFEHVAIAAGCPANVIQAVRALIYWEADIGAGDPKAKTDALARNRIKAARQAWSDWLTKKDKSTEKRESGRPLKYPEELRQKALEYRKKKWSVEDSIRLALRDFVNTYTEDDVPQGYDNQRRWLNRR